MIQLIGFVEILMKILIYLKILKFLISSLLNLANGPLRGRAPWPTQLTGKKESAPSWRRPTGELGAVQLEAVLTTLHTL